MTKDEKEFLGRGCALAIMIGTGVAAALGVLLICGAAAFWILHR